MVASNSTAPGHMLPIGRFWEDGMNDANQATLPRDITEDLYAGSGKLPVWRTIARSYAIVFRRLGPFVAIATLPILLTFAVQYTGNEIVVAWELNHRWRIVFEEPFKWIGWTVFSVAWHRYALLGQRDSKWPFQFSFGRREIRFMAYGAIVAIPLLLAWLVRVPLLYYGAEAQNLPMPYLLLAGALVVVGIFIGIRFSFIFPSVSVERRTGLTKSWRETQGNGWRIFWVTFIASMPLAVLDRLARELVILMQPIVARSGRSAWQNPLGHWMIGLTIAQLIFAFLFAAVLISALCIAFRRHTDWQPPADAEARSLKPD